MHTHIIHKIQNAKNLSRKSHILLTIYIYSHAYTLQVYFHFLFFFSSPTFYLQLNIEWTRVIKMWNKKKNIRVPKDLLFHWMKRVVRLRGSLRQKKISNSLPTNNGFILFIYYFTIHMYLVFLFLLLFFLLTFSFIIIIIIMCIYKSRITYINRKI